MEDNIKVKKIEDNVVELKCAEPLSSEEKRVGLFLDARRGEMIRWTKAEVMRKQLINAYSYLEKVRFESGLSDTAFRDKVIRAKRGIEEALEDYLLQYSYHSKKMSNLVDCDKWYNDQNQCINGCAGGTMCSECPRKRREVL